MQNKFNFSKQTKCFHRDQNQTVFIVDCPRPTNLNPYVTIVPDEESYETWHAFSTSCLDGYSKFGPDTIYCTQSTTDYWDPDPSLVECFGNLSSLFFFFN